MMRMVGVTTKHFGNGEIRFVLTDDPKMVKAMQVQYKYDANVRARPGCLVFAISGIEIDVTGQKTLVRFGQPRKV